MVIWPGLRRTVSSAIQRLFNGASFSAPLTHSAIPTRAASGTTGTFTRATTATVRDNEGVLRTAIAGEARFEGARRVYNQWSVASEPTSSTGYHTATNVTFDSGISGFAGSAYFADASVNRTLRPLANSAALNRTWLVSFYVQRDDGGVPDLNGYDDLTLTLDGSDILSGVTVTLVSGTLYRAVKKWTPTSSQEVIVRKYTGGFNNNNPIRATGFQLEDITGRADQTTPSEYVSVGVLSAPYHGAGVDGVKCFPTDLSGNPIAASINTGYVAEGARTNLKLRSNAFSTDGAGAPWGVYGTPAATQDKVGPDGALSGWTLTDNAPASVEGVWQNVTITAATYTDSVYVAKTSGAQTSYPVIYAANAGGTLAAPVTVDTTNGIATVWSAYTGLTIATGLTARCVSHNSLWWRVEFSFTGTAEVWTFVYLPAASSTANKSTGVLDLTVQGSAGFAFSQTELGSFASSYIPTTTIAVARNGDVLTYSSAGNVDVTKGWAYAEVTYPNGAGLQKGVINTSNGAPLYISSTNKVSLYDGTSERFGTSFSVSANTQKIASTWGGAASSTANAGVVTATSGFDGDLSLVGSLEIGSNTGGSNSAFGIIRGIRIGQRLLSTSEEGAITA